MADVYFAEQALLSRRVVIKVLHAHLGKDPEIAERFRREAESAAQLCHPHVCPILDYGDVDGVVYTVSPAELVVTSGASTLYRAPWLQYRDPRMSAAG